MGSPPASANDSPPSVGVYEEDFELSDISNADSSLGATPWSQITTPTQAQNEARRKIFIGEQGATPKDVLEMSLTPKDIRRERTREPNFNPLENEDWRDPEGQMVAWRLNSQDGWCYPIHPQDSEWLFNMASGVWFNAAAEKYCQEVEGRGFVYGQTMIAGNGQMYFVPDENGSPVRKKATDLAVETGADQGVLQRASPVA